MPELEIPKENRFSGTIRPLQADDLTQIKPILETWIRFPTKTGTLLAEEVEETLEEMEKSTRGENDKIYFVAETTDGQIAGSLGYQHLRDEMKSYATTDKPAEVINAYVADEHRAGKGVGTALFSFVESELKQKGFKEFLLNSGPRYRNTAWGFYDKLIGPSVGQLDNFYGEGFHAPVWRKVF